jgi:Protein of unknown function (DUF3309)
MTPRKRVNIGALLLLGLIVLLAAALATWPHSVDWGYYPSSLLGVLLLVLLAWLFFRNR